MLGFDDKRNFFRMMVNAPCELKLKDDESVRTLQALCKDISATGMSFDVEESSVELGTMVDVTIESTSSQVPSLTASAKIVRCEALSDTHCTIGVEIIEMR